MAKIKSMNMLPVIGYVRKLRKLRGLRPEDLASKIGLSGRQYIRWENQEKGGALKAEQLLAALLALDAPWDDVSRLFSDPEATEEQGEQAAQVWYEEHKPPDDDPGDDDLRVAIQEMQRNLNDLARRLEDRSVGGMRDARAS